MVRAQFYIISLVIAAVYLITIAALLSPPATQPYDPTPQVFDNIQLEVERIARASPDPQTDLQNFDAFLQRQLSELNYGYGLQQDPALTRFTLTLSSDRTRIKNEFEAAK